MTPPHNDNFLWLEDVEGERALAWVREHNALTHARLREHPAYAGAVDTALALLDDTERIPFGTLRGDHLYNLWQDADHERGLWRRILLDDYIAGSNTWEPLLDVDALAREEGESWVFQQAVGLGPDHQRFMLRLSPGGSDAAVLREFDVESRSFIKDGFFVPESKSHATWLDADHLLLSSAFDPERVTTSGYAQQMCVWQRHTPLQEATPILSIEPDEVGLYPARFATAEGPLVAILRRIDFYRGELYLVTSDFQAQRLPLPDQFGWSQAVFQGKLVFITHQDWTPQHTLYPRGSLLSLDLEPLLEGNTDSLHIERVVTPGPHSALEGVHATRDGILVSSLDHVRARLTLYRPGDDGWVGHPLKLPHDLGTVLVRSASPQHARALLSYEDLLTPTTLLLMEDGHIRKLRSLPERFDTTGLVLEQHHATSRDGTPIPYFLVRPEDLDPKGSHPTLLYAYGGFNIARVPTYDPTLGKLWLERGRLYAIANIRGGGEHGPRWHQAALKANRQRAYDDFHAVAQSLIDRNLTQPSKLAIRGGSNGGLLVGVAFTQRPDLYGAVICQVPLLDMLRFHKLHAGASWIAEYGDPDIPEERAWVAAYSPYQALRPDAAYPRVLFMTSTKDDRVHPSHARRMVARMQDLGHDVFYFENIEGGHAGVTNHRQAAESIALRFRYLEHELGL